MGNHKVDRNKNEQSKVEFLRHLLDDIEALEYMLVHNRIESDIVRIGAEQEFCLVNEQWRPANNALKVLEEISDEHFTTELARYNLEINLDPVELKGKAFKHIENQLNSLLQKATQAATNNNNQIVLTGILPSLSLHELDLDFMTPNSRYYALNDLMKNASDGTFKMHVYGVDELSIIHDSIMFEACNTSFQMHLQIHPNDFMSSYNWAQAIAAPILGICTNSPLLLGKELWSETRIALFQQSIDTRVISQANKHQQPRVTFGNEWVSGGILEFYKKEISNYKILLSKKIKNLSTEQLKNEKTPKLEALNLHNGTIYRWNRLCYGVGNGKPHFRIENRYIPSGPTVSDEIANFAFWVGLMKGRPTEFDDLPAIMDFRDAKSNFIKAARYGSESMMYWKGRNMPLTELVLNELIPIAKRGLEKMKINPIDIDYYLGIIKERTQKQTGSQWIVKNYRDLKKQLKTDDALVALTERIHKNQISGKTIGNWPQQQKLNKFDTKASKIGHIMSRHLFTADAHDTLNITLRFMKWNNIHHLPVVTNNETLVGLITWQHLNKNWDRANTSKSFVYAKDIMISEVITVNTSTEIMQAIALMKEKEIGCLPVLENSQLVGIVTVKDLFKFADV